MIPPPSNMILEFWGFGFRLWLWCSLNPTVRVKARQLRPGQPQPLPPQQLPPQSLLPQPDDVDPDLSLLDLRQCPNALRIAGALHVSDNCLGSSLQAMSTWNGLLKNLRVVEILLKDVKFRERFQHFNVADKSSKDKLKNWSLSLRGLRWQSVLRFTAELLPLEKILRPLGAWVYQMLSHLLSCSSLLKARQRHNPFSLMRFSLSSRRFALLRTRKVSLSCEWYFLWALPESETPQSLSLLHLIPLTLTLTHSTLNELNLMCLHYSGWQLASS